MHRFNLMFNKNAIVLKKIGPILIAFLIIVSCKEEPTPLTFKDQSIERKVNAIIDIHYPKAEGHEAVAKKINTSVENFIANEINMNEDPDEKLTLEVAIQAFDNEYKSFKSDFSDSTQQWEAIIESEVNYDSDNVITIAVNFYMDTGGAHGNSRITFLNFDKKTGDLLEQGDIISDKEVFKDFVRPYFEKATKSLSNEDAVEDPFYGEGFQLPENIGYSDQGLILLYNVYEIASYAQGVTEFNIPFEQAKPYLKVY